MNATNSTTDKEMLNASAVADLLSISYKLVVQLPIPHLKIVAGKKTFRRYERQAVMDYIKENTHCPDPMKAAI